MATKTTMRWILLAWSVGAMVLGAATHALHQPFNTPDATRLANKLHLSTNDPQVIHILSTSCGCSKKVMTHLLQRHPIPGVKELVLIVDDTSPSLEGTPSLLAGLQDEGFTLEHKPVEDVARNMGLHGVPLMIVMSKSHVLQYEGGYGRHYDDDSRIIAETSRGLNARSLPAVGCAVGAHLKRLADPLHLKY